ncbi:MAG: hypothetical protein ACI9QV_001148 [Methylophagaceae bacterium]|jgi:hypothetical protein
MGYTFQHLGHFLAKNQPTQGQYLIVEGWIDEQALLDAKALFDLGQYKVLITSGGPITNTIKPDYPSYADKAAAFLVSQGFDPHKLRAAPAPASAQNRTYLSAVKVRQWFEQHAVKPASFDILSSGVHARRTQKLYQIAFNDSTKIGIIAIRSEQYPLDHWWQSSDGIKSVLTEIVGLGYTFCCFDPGKVGSHQELWGIY